MCFPQTKTCPPIQFFRQVGFRFLVVAIGRIEIHKSFLMNYIMYILMLIWRNWSSPQIPRSSVFNWKVCFYMFSWSLIPNLVLEVNFHAVLVLLVGISASRSICSEISDEFANNKLFDAHLRNEGCWTNSYQLLTIFSFYLYLLFNFWNILNTQFHFAFYMKYIYIRTHAFESNNGEILC